MTSKELLYVQDALGHEKFLKCESKQAAGNISDEKLASYIGELEEKHNEIFSKFLKLL